MVDFETKKQQVKTDKREKEIKAGKHNKLNKEELNKQKRYWEQQQRKALKELDSDEGGEDNYQVKQSYDKKWTEYEKGMLSEVREELTRKKHN